jgi:hypothetical protein
MVRLIDEIVWAVNPKNDTLEKLVTYICNFAEQFFRDSPTRAASTSRTSIPPQIGVRCAATIFPHRQGGPSQRRQTCRDRPRLGPHQQ